ncbi:MAG: DNA topology modulation protein [Pseudomonadota bacterium]|nr:DNA topology modulation protein [Pseudomonadota bacterium]
MIVCLQVFLMKLMIFGKPGSGKSSFAYQLAKMHGYPLYHLDKYFFMQNWQARPKAEFLADQRLLVANDAWIIDGNAIDSLEMRWREADAVMYFNYSFWRCFFGIILRRFRGPVVQVDDRARLCPEQISWRLLEYLWHFEYYVDPVIAKLRLRYPNVPFFEICRDRDWQGFLQKDGLYGIGKKSSD